MLRLILIGAVILVWLVISVIIWRDMVAILATTTVGTGATLGVASRFM